MEACNKVIINSRKESLDGKMVANNYLLQCNMFSICLLCHAFNYCLIRSLSTQCQKKKKTSDWGGGGGGGGGGVRGGAASAKRKAHKAQMFNMLRT